MFLGSAFLTAGSKHLGLPSALLSLKSSVPEVMFVGESNAGKSSLINALFGTTKEQLAKTSRKPGHTKSLNFYLHQEDQIVFVDVPGYGKKSLDDWGQMVIQYLNQRRPLRRVFLLRDIRESFSAKDRQMMSILEDFGVGFQVVLMKCDLYPPEFEKFREEFVVGRALKYLTGNYANCVPSVIQCSSRTLHGLDSLELEIRNVCRNNRR